MAALLFGNRFIAGKTQSLVPILAPPARVCWRSVVCINNVAGRTTAGTIIARVIVRAEESEQRIVQPGFLDAEKNRIGPVEGAETALRQSPQRSAIRFFRGWNAELQLFFPALFKDAQDIARVAQVEARQRV